MKYSILLFLIVFSFVCGAHPSNISIINIELTDSSIQIKIDIQKHDLVQHILNNRNYDSNNNKFSNENITTVEEYINNNFQIIINDKPLLLNNISIENSETNFVISITKKLESKCLTITLVNKLLLDFPLEQKNLLIISYNDYEKGIEFNADKTSETIKF